MQTLGCSAVWAHNRSSAKCRLCIDFKVGARAPSVYLLSPFSNSFFIVNLTVKLDWPAKIENTDIYTSWIYIQIQRQIEIKIWTIKLHSLITQIQIQKDNSHNYIYKYNYRYRYRYRYKYKTQDTDFKFKVALVGLAKWGEPKDRHWIVNIYSSDAHSMFWTLSIYTIMRRKVKRKVWVMLVLFETSVH